MTLFIDRSRLTRIARSWSARAVRCCLIIAALIGSGAPACFGAVEIPERPANHLLDQGHIFPPEVAKRLSDSLLACARDYDVHIFVMTVPTLQVMPSRVREKLDELGVTVTESWTKGLVGAVIVFDDEAGWVTVAASDEAEREFSAVAINMIFRDPLVETRKKHLSPEKLEAAAMVLVNGLTDLRIESNREASRHRKVRFVLGFMLGGALLIMLWRALQKRRESPAKAAAEG